MLKTQLVGSMQRKQSDKIHYIAVHPKMLAPSRQKEKVLLGRKYPGLDFSNCPTCPNPARNGLIFEFLRNLVNWQTTGQLSILKIPNNKQTAQTPDSIRLQKLISRRGKIVGSRLGRGVGMTHILPISCSLSQIVRFHCDSECEDRWAKISKHRRGSKR